MLLFEMKKQRGEAIAKADAIVTLAEKEKRNLTDAERSDIDASMAAVTTLTPQIDQLDSLNTLRAKLAGTVPVLGGDNGRTARIAPKTFSREYFEAFWGSMGNRSAAMEAALYEGSNSAGGYAVPITVDGTIVPLAPQEFAIRKLATVVATSNDIKLPIQSSRATAAAKAESGGSDNSFTATSPALTQKTLSSHMAGGYTDVSWEAAQDANLLQALATPDLINAVQVYEEGKFCTGAGTTEPEGVCTAADFGVAHSVVDLDKLLDLIGTLNAEYHDGASFLMHRTTSILVRKAQLEANLFDPVWSRVGTQDYLYGYPVSYSSSMPQVGQGNKIMVFGDFKRGFLIGDRGGSGISVKFLDQTKALLGLIQVMAYRRTDSLVRRSEALKTFVIDSGS